MAISQTWCHLKAGRAKIPGVSSPVSHLLFVTGGTTHSWKHFRSSSSAAARHTCERRNKKQLTLLSFFTHLWLQSQAAAFPSLLLLFPRTFRCLNGDCAVLSPCALPPSSSFGSRRWSSFHESNSLYLCFRTRPASELYGELQKWSSSLRSNKAQTQCFLSCTKSSRNRLPSARNMWGSSCFNLAGDHSMLKNVLQNILITSNFCFCLKWKLSF